MVQFILNNLGTIITGLAVAGLLVLVITKMVRDKRKGKSSCSCGCSGCAMSEHCHKAN